MPSLTSKKSNLRNQNVRCTYTHRTSAALALAVPRCVHPAHLPTRSIPPHPLLLAHSRIFRYALTYWLRCSQYRSPLCFSCSLSSTTAAINAGTAHHNPKPISHTSFGAPVCSPSQANSRHKRGELATP